MREAVGIVWQRKKEEMTGKEKKKEQDNTDFRFIDRNTTAFLINMRRKELICKKLMPPTLSGLPYQPKHLTLPLVTDAKNARSQIPPDNPLLKQRVRNYLLARSKYKANCTSTWPANPITALRQDSAQMSILDPDAMNKMSEGASKRILMPAGYNDKEGLCKVFVPSAPNVVNIKDPFMYKTCQERSLSQPFAPPQKQFVYKDPNVDRSKFNALDLVLERREKLKDEAKKLEEEIKLRRNSTYIPTDPPVNDTLKFRPSSKAGFEKTLYRMRPGTKSRAMDMNTDKWQVDRRPISGRTRRQIVSNIIPGSSFTWSSGYVTQNQHAGL